MSAVAIAISGSITSAVAGYLIPTVINFFHTRSHPEILGTWISHYQGIDEPSGTWVTEKLDVSMGINQIKIENKQSSHGYEYKGKFRLKDGKYIAGDWESIRPGATAQGGLLLTVASQGKVMYGYWVGADEFGARRYGRWVLTKSENDIPYAKELLEEMRKSRQN